MGDNLEASNGQISRQKRELRNKAQLLQRQVEALDANAEQTALQLIEAEDAHNRLHEESEATERRAEIIHWKLQVAETQLTSRLPRPRTSRGSIHSGGALVRDIGRDAAVSSDSAGVGQ